MDYAEANRLLQELQASMDAYTSEALLAADDPKAVAQELKAHIADLEHRLDESLGHG